MTPRATACAPAERSNPSSVGAALPPRLLLTLRVAVVCSRLSFEEFSQAMDRIAPSFGASAGFKTTALLPPEESVPCARLVAPWAQPLWASLWP